MIRQSDYMLVVGNRVKSMEDSVGEVGVAELRSWHLDLTLSCPSFNNLLSPTSSPSNLRYSGLNVPFPSRYHSLGYHAVRIHAVHPFHLQDWVGPS